MDLPKHVIAPEGQLTLFAAYAEGTERGTALFLVNRSPKEVRFSTQDGVPHIKLEYQRPDGTWVRAESHENSDCGNSYGSRTLPSGHHYQFAGYQVQKGTPASVRYACHGKNVISNVGEGLYDPAEVERAGGDILTLAWIPVELLMQDHLCLLNAGRPGGEEHLPKEAGIASLELVRVLGGAMSLRKKAEGWVEQLSNKPQLTADESNSMSALMAVLARPWPQKMDRDRLLNHCLKSLRSPTLASITYGSPESRPALLWLTLADLAEPSRPGANDPPGPVTPRSWKPVLEMIAERLATASEKEQRSMIQILQKQTAGADEWLPDAFFESCLFSPNQDWMHLGAGALSRRARWERLVELGWKVPPANQIAVLRALIKGQSPLEEPKHNGEGAPRSPAPTTEEARFWQHCMATQPLECAQCFSPAAFPYLRFWVRDLKPHLFKRLMAEAELNERMAGEYEMELKSYETASAFELLVPQLHPYFRKNMSWEPRKPRPDDGLVELLNRLLNHQGYTSSWNRTEERRHFFLRQQAGEALRKLGEPVPHDLAIGREVTATPDHAGQKNPK